MIQHASVPSGVDLSKYTPCPRTPEPDNYDDMDDAAYFVYKLKMAKYYPLPFKYMFFCDMFKPELYSEIVRHFPPTTVMEPAVKRAATEVRPHRSHRSPSRLDTENVVQLGQIEEVYNRKSCCSHSSIFCPARSMHSGSMLTPCLLYSPQFIFAFFETI